MQVKNSGMLESTATGFPEQLQHLLLGGKLEVFHCFDDVTGKWHLLLERTFKGGKAFFPIKEEDISLLLNELSRTFPGKVPTTTVAVVS